DPARGREQVVVCEREVGAHHERVAEEDREAHDPRAHEEQHEPSASPGGFPLDPPAIDRRCWGGSLGRRPCCRLGDQGGPPPPFWAWASCASICLSRFRSPAARSFTWPACHLTTKLWIRAW